MIKEQSREQNKVEEGVREIRVRGADFKRNKRRVGGLWAGLEVRITRGIAKQRGIKSRS